jgi:hypothetical protein
MRTEFIKPQGASHYLCKKVSAEPPIYDNENNEIIGCGTQFTFNEDPVVHFPYNMIFMGRKKEEFFRKPILVIRDRMTQRNGGEIV